MNANNEDSSWLEIPKEERGDDSYNIIEKSADNLKRNLQERTISPSKETKSIYLKTSSNSSDTSYSAIKIKNIKCNLHGIDNLMIDQKSFKVKCIRCIETGDHRVNLKIIDSSDEGECHEEEKVFLECINHAGKSSNFYCDDCQSFLCQVCFANIHRLHSSHILSEFVERYKNDLRGMISSVNDMKPKIESSLKHISDIDKQIKNFRKTSASLVNGYMDKLNSKSNDKCAKLNNSFECIFEGIDIEADNVVGRLDSLQKIVFKYTIEISEILNFIKSKSNPGEICQFVKTKNSKIKEINKMIDDKKNFIEFKVKKLKEKSSNNMKEFSSQIEKLLKQTKIYEDSITSSINTGISSSSIRLRRFRNTKYMSKYYKTSSIECKFSTGVCLVGLGLCGIHQNMDENKLKSVDQLNQMINKLSIPTKISINEIKQNESTVELLSEIHNITCIINPNDPIIAIYFNKALNLKPDKRYLITCNCLHKEVLQSRWYGESCKETLNDNNQTVCCNSSGIKFTFSPANGIESDFDECYNGIIADFIFSYN